MKFWRLSGIRLDLSEKEDVLAEKAAELLKIQCSDIIHLDIIKRSLDARRHHAPRFVYVLKIVLPSTIELPFTMSGNIHLEEINEEQAMPFGGVTKTLTKPVVVIGAGPAGLFAAHELLRHHLPVMLLERGSALEKRIRDVEKFWSGQGLNPQSNVLFGEGGAGTFSDGKLTSRTKSPHATWVKSIFVELGANPEILRDAKPHIGTDCLRKVIAAFRKRLLSMGCVIHFDTQATGFVVNRERIQAVIVNDKDEIKTDCVILAMGQSADDTYQKLMEAGVLLKAKPFAMGLRVEHPQELINEIQYGKWRHHPQLPPAEYFLTSSLPNVNRSIYSFCMCPGGAVIGCSTQNGFLCVNGMSYASRSGNFANAAVVVNVKADDFTGDPRDPLGGLAFRKIWEGKAFESGGGSFWAPAQKMTDFLSGKFSELSGQSTYRPGIRAVRMDTVLPKFVTEALKQGLQDFDKKMRGFVTEEALLIGVETRTSSPVRVCRGKDGQSETVKGIYPCGEGAGYAGGIISSAIDGIKVAQKLMTHLQETSVDDDVVS